MLDVSEQRVRRYSEMREKEWRRLTRGPYHRLEFDTAMHFLKGIFTQQGFGARANASSLCPFCIRFFAPLGMFEQKSDYVGGIIRVR